MTLSAPTLGSTVGLFLHDKADPGQIRASANDADAQVRTLGSTRGALQFRHPRAVAGTGGALTGPAAAALVPVIKAIETVMQSTSFAAGCTRY